MYAPAYDPLGLPPYPLPPYPPGDDIAGPALHARKKVGRCNISPGFSSQGILAVHLRLQSAYVQGGKEQDGLRKLSAGGAYIMLCGGEYILRDVTRRNYPRSSSKGSSCSDFFGQPTRFSLALYQDRSYVSMYCNWYRQGWNSYLLWSCSATGWYIYLVTTWVLPDSDQSGR